ncbi:MAG TPA: secretin N-terminal domain-containing protein [Vicinamibacterales bacterium]
MTAHANSRFAPLLLLTLILAGCATTGALRSARNAELAQDYDRAVVEYTRVLQQDPDNRDAHFGLERSKLRAAEAHFMRGRRHDAAGRLTEALVELQLAAELNPTDPNIVDLLNSVQTQARAGAGSRGGKTQLETLIERSRNLQPPGLELPPDVRLPAALTFRDASARDIYTALARFANLNIVFDPQFRDQPITIDLRNASVEDALTSLSTATRNFYRVTAQRTVTVVPDTPAKRTEYEDEIVRTFYLSNADVKETLDLLRIVIDNRRLAPITATNALSIKDTPERVAAAGRLISAIDKARPEVVIDVELLEIDRTRLLEYGLQIASPGAPGVNGTADVNREDFTLRDLRNLDQSGVFLTNVPALFYRLLKTDNNTRVLANPQLRTSEGMTASARFGERVPVPVTTFAPIATGGVAQQPITSFNYENIGVNIDIAPRTHHDAEVSLALKILVSSISGTGFGGLPTFGNREISTVIRLRDGETNLLAGLIRDDERRIAEGIPGLSDLPVVGRLFAHNRRETQETDIVLTLTPHIIRVLELSEDDLRPFRVGRGAGGTGVIDLPISVEPPPQQQPPPPPAAPPAGAPAPAAPIQPPAPQPAPGPPPAGLP